MKLWTLLIIAFLFLSACKKADLAEAPATPVSNPTRLSLGSVSARGVFDPSQTYDSSSNTLWMSYSAVNTSAFLYPAQNVISTRLASSADGGITWVDAGQTFNPTLDVNLTFSGLPPQGAWQHEVSRLLYDPFSTSAATRWKLFSHHYLQIKSTDPATDRRFEHGWIAYKMAATPAGLATATEIKLFGALGYDTANNTAAGTTGSPLAGSPIIGLQTLHADLNSCLIFTEPGFLSTATQLYMSLMCAEPGNVRIVLFKCAQPCAVTAGWSYVATLLQNSNAAAVGYLNFSATELFESNGINYLMVSPEGVTMAPGIYHGCMTFKFTDISTGALQGSPPTVVKTINGTTGSFNGACSYQKENVNGFLYSEFVLNVTDGFQIFNSTIKN